MKKFFAIFIVICMVAGAFCITVSATEPGDGVVIRVSGLKEDGSVYSPENSDYTGFAEGWEAAVDYARDEDWMEDHDDVRVVVDFFAD